MQSGTDLAKDVSDVVLTGTYEAIASAVQVGRTILYRARLYIHALLSYWKKLPSVLKKTVSRRGKN